MRILENIQRGSVLYFSTYSIHAAPPTMYIAGSNAAATYSKLPSDYELRNVVVIVRHGDRAQISRELGPNYPENGDITKVWNGALPVDKTLRLMHAAAASPIDFTTDPLNFNTMTASGVITEKARELQTSHLTRSLYTGWDAINAPYAMLTEKGCQQLMLVGKELKRRYVGTLLPASKEEAANFMYCRSTNICRTIQSLRSLLVGLFDVQLEDTRANAKGEGEVVVEDKVENNAFLRRNSLPTIHTRPKSQETLFPQADGRPCAAMSARRSEIFPDNFLATKIDGYTELESKMRRILGYGSKVNWLAIKEILTCYKEHDVPYPEGISYEDADRVTDLAGKMWGMLYKDDKLNRLAIGRFIGEMVHELSKANMKPFTLQEQSSSSAASSSSSSFSKVDVSGMSTLSDVEDSQRNAEEPRMIIYSGHDSTLVPILCALGIYDDIWPPYASYLTLETVQSKTTQKYFIRATYNDKDMVIPGSPQGSVFCPLDVVLARLKELTITWEEYLQECGVPETSDLTSSRTSPTVSKEMEEEIQSTIGGVRVKQNKNEA